ncbi:MarR family winged helix-turn-helix transcriptional regulator [Microbacterium sp. ASV81]|uniref:MarR family transcriptional regulator n=1 Tax=Microbacterium capsulatum TaxID=3041921 RepID=A0ABU0XBL1_9MICO|nr:MarR family transcriptional regulator [Microbacterium sp. ASV81]MDQ4212487.1 MarR family transcriptional regulator [Microbacterium sp. ASV81]
MNRGEILQSIVFSAHTLTRIAAQEAGNDAPAAQWRALSLLDTTGDQRVGELAKASRTTQPGMTRLIGQLEHEGLVRRDPDPDDSRATVVTITEAGRNALHSWRQELQRILEPRFSDLDETEWQVLALAAEIMQTHSSLLERTAR